MNIKKGICFLLVFLAFFAKVPRRVLAEERNIYIGDIITLQILSREISAEEITEKFRDFEILEIKKEKGGYAVSLRTFEVGEYRIMLGGPEIIINVKSTLEDIERDGIFESDKQIEKSGFLLFSCVLFYFFCGIFVLSGAFLLFKKIGRGKVKTLSALECFFNRCVLLSEEDENYFVDLTYYFKEYLESLYKFKIIGKTSAEILNELKEIKALEGTFPHIREWLDECDRFKFTGIRARTEEKKAHYVKLLNLAKNIDTQKEVTI